MGYQVKGIVPQIRPSTSSFKNVILDGKLAKDDDLDYEKAKLDVLKDTTSESLSSSDEETNDSTKRDTDDSTTKRPKPKRLKRRKARTPSKSLRENVLSTKR